MLDRLVATFLEELSGIESTVDFLLTNSTEKQQISGRFRQLHRLKEALDLRNRFVMAHGRTNHSLVSSRSQSGA